MAADGSERSQAIDSQLLLRWITGGLMQCMVITMRCAVPLSRLLSVCCSVHRNYLRPVSPSFPPTPWKRR